MRQRVRTFVMADAATSQTAEERRAATRARNRRRRGMPEEGAKSVGTYTPSTYTRMENGVLVSHQEDMTTAELYRWRRYGLKPSTYREMLNNQAGACAVCRQVKPLHVDHCHRTNRVRGLLCGPCNTSLGHFKEDIATLNRAIRYLQRE